MIAPLLLLLTQAPLLPPTDPTQKSTTTTETPAAPLRIAVYDLEVGDVEPRVARIITEALLVELRKLDRVSVIGIDEVRAILDFEAKRQLTGCTDESCLADVAGALGADVIITGSLARVGDEVVFGARRIAQRTAQTQQQVALRLEDAGGEEFVAAIGPVVEQLFPDVPLRVGAHRGADPALALRVHPPPLAPWMFWSTVAGAGVVGAATAAVGVANVAAANKFAGVTAAQNGKDVVRNDEFVGASGVVFWSGVGVTAVTLAVAGVEALFVDWQSYGAASSGTSP